MAKSSVIRKGYLKVKNYARHLKGVKPISFEAAHPKLAVAEARAKKRVGAASLASAKKKRLSDKNRAAVHKDMRVMSHAKKGRENVDKINATNAIKHQVTVAGTKKVVAGLGIGGAAGYSIGTYKEKKRQANRRLSSGWTPPE